MKMNRRAMLKSSASLSLAAPLMGFARKPAGSPEAATSNGPIRGYASNGIAVFKGIRYGADTATTRFAKPAKPQPWTEVCDATSYGAASPQNREREPMSEDCLFLNLWTPALADGGRRPVMVYFHGGAYASGSGSAPLYDGTNLATKGDVVVITVNHRLNAFGYLSLAKLNTAFPDSGNAGMWDLVLALEWVRDNAVSFGGDPSRIMLFGQSGGGAKIATLMAAPSAKGLFHSGATMSGQQVTACGPLNGKARAEAYLDKLSIDPADTNALKSLPLETLVEALAARDPVNPENGLYFGPVMDGRFLSRHPFWPDAPSQSTNLPMILGNTHDETRNLIGNREPDSFTLDWLDLPARLSHHMRCDIDADEVISRYREIYPSYSPSDVFFAATTAGRSWRGQVEEADARARESGPTWVYQMDLASPDDGGKWGAPHAIDIAHAFDNPGAEGSITGTAPDARRVADQLSRAFIALASAGDPNHAGLPYWQRHTLPSRQTMVFGETTRLVNDPRKAERELFAKVPFTQWGT
tara:strand:- start:386 stop:1963 length:1578 start_codon:yes stop_codon:yes gene_type:complete